MSQRAMQSPTCSFAIVACCLQLLVCFVPLFSCAQVTCAKQFNSCQCQTESGKYIDLAPLALRDDYRFKRVQGPSFNWLYSYNPCFGFTCEGASNVAMCQNSYDSKDEFALGTQDSAIFNTILGTGLHLRYSSSHTGTTRVSLVTLDCSQLGQDVFVPTNDGSNNQDNQDVTYTSTLTSRYACEVDSLTDLGGGGAAGISVGDVLLIIFFVGAFVYLTAGFAVNVLLLKKQPGLGALPNTEFWLAQPGHVKDGGVFCWSKLRQLCTMRRGGYDSV